MKIVDVTAQPFTYRSQIARDSEGHSHPVPEYDATECLVEISTDEGVSGYCFGGHPAGAIQHVIKPMLVGEDPFYREKLWQKVKQAQRGSKEVLSDRLIGVVDQALWDLAGRALGQPVYKLLGGARDKVPAYASTMCGDEVAGGLNTPEAYGEFAAQCRAQGYTAFKLHTWMPPIPWAPDPKQDVAACRAVRERVGDDMALMLDCFHHYSREEALYIGKELEQLNYHWFEEPMDEHNVSSYVWLTEQLSIPVLGPETAEGQMFHAGGVDRARGLGHEPRRRRRRGRDHAADEDGASLRVVRRADGSAWRRAGQPARPLCDGHSRGILRARAAPSLPRLRAADAVAQYHR